MPIAKLSIDLEARLTKFEAGLTKAQYSAERSARKIEGAFSGVGDTIHGAFAGIVAGLSVSAITNLIQQAVDAQDALVDLSKSTDIAVDKLAGIGFAAQTTGGDLESIAAAINKLQVNIGKDPEKYKQLGIDAKNGYEAFKQLADIFVSIEDPEKRSAVAAEALGKAWAGSAAALSEGGKGFSDLVAKGEKLSSVTVESAARAAELNSKLDILKARASGAAHEFVNSLVPSLDRTAVRMEALAAQGNGLQAVFIGLIGLAKLPFDAVFGEVDLSHRKQVSELENTLSILETKAKRAESADGGLLNQWVYGKKGEFDQQILATRGQLDALKKFGDKLKPSGDGESKPKPPSSDAINRFIHPGGTSNGGRANTSKTVDDGQRLLQQLKDRILATQHLTEVEKLEAEIADGKYKTASAANLEKAKGFAQTLDNLASLRAAADAAAEEQRKRADDFQRIFDATRTPAEALNIEIDRLLTLLDNGTLGEGAAALELFGRAAQQAGEKMQSLEEQVQRTVEGIDVFAKSAAKNIQSAFAEFLFDPFANGTKSMLQSFGETVRRMIANAAAADLGRRLFGDLGGKGGLGGVVGAGLDRVKDWLKDALPSFDIGTAYVPRDMIAQIHKGERIVPAADNRPGALGGHSISVVINMGGSGSPEEVRRAGGAAAREVLGAISAARRYS